jgi:hypothetical protein
VNFSVIAVVLRAGAAAVLVADLAVLAGAAGFFAGVVFVFAGAFAGAVRAVFVAAINNPLSSRIGYLNGFAPE